MHTGVWLGKLKERDYPEDPVIDDEIILTYFHLVVVLRQVQSLFQSELST